MKLSQLPDQHQCLAEDFRSLTRPETLWALTGQLLIKVPHIPCHHTDPVIHIRPLARPYVDQCDVRGYAD